MLKKSLFYFLMLAFVLLVLETFAWLLIRMGTVDGLFDHRAGVLQRINDEDLRAYLRWGGSQLSGWESRGPVVRSDNNCMGEPKKYSYDETGARIYQRYDRSAVKVIVAGDSFTKGDDVQDHEAFPAQLAAILGSSVANHGVGAYGPAQAFLMLTEKVQLYPNADTAILAIMYENLYRMMNSYRPVLYDKDHTYGLKPYMTAGEIKPHPGQEPFANAESFRRYANRSFDEDFWSKPDAVFPYSYSLTRAMTTNYFLHRKFKKHLRKLGIPEYSLAFRSRDVTMNLLSLINQFAEFSVDNGLRPVVVFIPQNQYDVESASRLIKDNREHFHEALLIGDVGNGDIDWQRFNLQETDSDKFCHPSPYGYRKIAEYIAGLLRQKSRSEHSLRQY